MEKEATVHELNRHLAGENNAGKISGKSVYENMGLPFSH
jgi:hypothetical protein